MLNCTTCCLQLPFVHCIAPSCNTATSETFFTNEGARQAGDKALHLTTVAGNVSSLRTIFRYVFGRSMTPGECASLHALAPSWLHGGSCPACSAAPP
jgi:hypothetical protein